MTHEQRKKYKRLQSMLKELLDLDYEIETMQFSMRYKKDISDLYMTQLDFMIEYSKILEQKIERGDY